VKIVLRNCMSSVNENCPLTGRAAPPGRQKKEEEKMKKT
jgi:hypothetical protein